MLEMLKKAILLAIGLLAGVTVACSSETTGITVAPTFIPTAISEPTPEPVPTRGAPGLLGASNIYNQYQRVEPSGETIRFKGIILYGVTGPDGRNILAHLAATSGGDVVSVFPNDTHHMFTIAQLGVAKEFVSIEGTVKGWEQADLIVDSCTIIP